MRRVKATGPRLALAVALAAAAATLALTIAGPGALLGPPVLVVAAILFLPFLEWSPVPPRLVRLLPRAGALVLLVAALVAWFSRSLGTLVLEPALLPLLAGPPLLAVAVISAVAPRAFSLGRVQAPAAIGVLAAAGLNPSPANYGASALPFLRGSEHTAFAERYIALAVVVMAALWTSAILDSGPCWSRRAVATLGLSLALAVALAATGVIGLPLLQPHVERAVASAFAEGSTGLGGESTLGEFAELAVSRRRVLDLQTAPSSGGEWRLPSEVFTRFDGRRWTSPPPTPPSSTATGAPERSRVLRPATAPPRAGPLLEGIGAWFQVALPTADAVELRITQAEIGSWPLLLPRGSVSVTADAWLLEVDRYGLLRRPPGDPLHLYGALWSGDGRSGDASLTAHEVAETLELPAHVDPRLADLARQLARSPEPRQRIEATVRHLQTGYRYTLAPGAFRTGDPLAEFLFEKKAGYCEYFASAAVVLLRLQGVPARFVKGLSVGPATDHGGGLHVVRESDAHAWVEAWFPGQGWLEVDPTPPGGFLESRSRPSALARLAEHLRAALSSAWTRLTVRGPVAFLRWLASRFATALEQAVRAPLAWLTLAAVLLGRLVLRAVRARLRRAPPSPRDPSDEAIPADLRALVRELEHRWAAAGRSRPEGRGLLEHAQRIAAATEAPGPVRSAVAGAGPQIVEAYYRARFGGQAPSAAERLALHETLARP